MTTSLYFIPAVVVALLYVAAPLYIWLTFRQRSYSTFRLIEPHTVPVKVETFFNQFAPDLAREGFRVAGYVSNGGSVANVIAYMAVWIHQSRGQMANVFVVVPSVGRPTKVLEFETVSAVDGEAVATSNLRGNAGVFNPVPNRHKAQLPWIDRVADLYQVHLNRELRLFPAAASRYVSEASAIIESLEAETALQLREQARTGLFCETSRPGEFRPTFGGAWIFVYRLLPPFKQMRYWRARRRARADYLESMKSPAPRPENVTVTNVSPYEPELTQFPLQYA